MKILIVDDDRELRELIGFTLRSAGYTILEAGDGFEALRQHADAKPDLMILDVNLPGIDGFEVCRRIRVTADTPVRSEEHTSELQSRLGISYAVFCLDRKSVV